MERYNLLTSLSEDERPLACSLFTNPRVFTISNSCFHCLENTDIKALVLTVFEDAGIESEHVLTSLMVIRASRHNGWVI